MLRKILNKLNQQLAGVQVTNIPYKNSKITQTLQSGLTANSLITLISCCDTDTFKFNETFRCLKFASTILEMDKRLKQLMPDHIETENIERINRLDEEIIELKLIQKRTIKAHEEKLKNFAKLIGIDDDLENIIYATPHSAEYKLANKYKEAHETIKNLTTRNSELEERIKTDLISIKNSKSYLKEDVEIDGADIKQGNKSIADFKKKMKEFSDNYEEIMASTHPKELQSKLMVTHLEIEEKFSNLHILKSRLNSKSVDIKEAFNMRELGRVEIESNKRKQFNDRGNMYKTLLYEFENKYKDEIKQKDRENLDIELKYKSEIHDLE